jgi:hypothetical protein
MQYLSLVMFYFVLALFHLYLLILYFDYLQLEFYTCFVKAHGKKNVDESFWKAKTIICLKFEGKEHMRL